jgi:hypothetical protein
MRTIWKYSVFIAPGGFVHKIPKGARFLSVQVQDKDLPYMWFTVETDNPREVREFLLVETGQNIPQDTFTVSDYLGTILLDSGNYVLHLFEITDPVDALVKTIFTGW